MISFMQKNFDGWNEIKKKTNADETYLPLYHERQVRWCRLGANVGFEQDGTGKDFSRPVLIFKGLSRNVCLIIPLTTSTKENKYRVSAGIVDCVRAVALISQIRLVDTKRLDKQVTTIDKETFKCIRKAVKALL